MVLCCLCAICFMLPSESRLLVQNGVLEVLKDEGVIADQCSILQPFGLWYD